MADCTVKRIDEMEAAFGGAFKRARAELGVESFGMQVIDLPAGEERYPAHDHAEDGQEEVYLALRGSGEIEVAGAPRPLDGETMVRVGPGVERKVRPGEDGLRVLVVGGVAGKAYDPPEVSRLGSPDSLDTLQG